MKSYAIGARVSQTTYGAGTVTMTNEYHTVIDFDDHGVRTFSTPRVELEPSNTSAPVRAKRTRRKTARASEIR